MFLVLKRLLKWLIYLGGLLVVALTLFLTVPGFECNWKYPAEGTPWITLAREKRSGIDTRHATLGDYHVILAFVDGSIPVPPGEAGVQVKNGQFWYIGERWMFGAGTNNPFIK